jgi:hypothetical protein
MFAIKAAFRRILGREFSVSGATDDRESDSLPEKKFSLSSR